MSEYIEVWAEEPGQMTLDHLHHECQTCRFWSEMVAQSIGGGPGEALCLSQTGPRKSK